MIRRIMTPEERIAKRLSDIVSDVRIDLDLVGVYLARTSPSVPYNRLREIIESAQHEKEHNEFTATHYRLF
jgi:hypothetical protein